MKLELKQRIAKSQADSPITFLGLTDHYGATASRLHNVLNRHQIITIRQMSEFIDQYGGSIPSLRLHVKGVGSRVAELMISIVSQFNQSHDDQI